MFDYPDGRFAIKHQRRELPYRTFDKVRQVDQAAIDENKRLGPVLGTPTRKAAADAAAS
ncbi:hypothetical protein ABIA00_003301 [Bradyrhizobium ottawaense]